MLLVDPSSWEVKEVGALLWVSLGCRQGWPGCEMPSGFMAPWWQLVVEAAVMGSHDKKTPGWAVGTPHGWMFWALDSREGQQPHPEPSVPLFHLIRALLHPVCALANGPWRGGWQSGTQTLWEGPALGSSGSEVRQPGFQSPGCASLTMCPGPSDFPGSASAFSSIKWVQW